MRVTLVALFSENPSECECNVSKNVVVTYGEATAKYDIRTVSSPTRVPVTDHTAVIRPAEPVVTKTCNGTADLRQCHKDCANKTPELCQHLSAIDTQKKKVTSLTAKRFINNSDVLGTGNTHSAHAPVNSLCYNLPSVSGSALQESMPKCQSAAKLAITSRSRDIKSSTWATGRTRATHVDRHSVGKRR